MSYKKHILAAMVLMAASQSVFAGGVVLGATRVVYNESSKEASLTVNNQSDGQYFLVQSWIDDKSGNKQVPFAITPPLFRLNANKQNMLRIIRTGGNLPTDRESVYWVNVKAIPPAPTEGSQNVLQLAIKTRVKLFYRPAGLQGKAVDAPETLVWSQQGNDLVVKNPSAYSVTLGTVKVNNADVSNVDLVPAKDEIHYKLPTSVSHASSVSFTSINDYGGVTKSTDAKIN